VFGSRKASPLEAWLLRLDLVSSDFRKQHQAVPAAGARMCFKTMVFGCGEASSSETWLLPMKGRQMCGTILLPDPRAVYNDNDS